ncbi:MAG: zinc-dependent metalloprotease [Actinobacteria bacterium]|nr:zinc-dependent metalloprotease [Actinomycetota bacterium]
MSDHDPPAGDPDHSSSNDPPFNPFSGVPFMGDLFRAMGTAGQGGDPGRQIAMSVAAGGHSEPNVDPIERIEWERLVRVAELQVADRTGLDVTRGHSLTIEPVTRAAWASRSFDALSPLLGRLTETLNQNHGENEGESQDRVETSGLPSDGPESDMFAGWMQGLLDTIGPLMAGVMSGTLVGRLAARSLGTYDLPIPRADDSLLVVSPNVAGFGSEWNIPADDLRLWVCLHEALHHAVLGVPHVRETLNDLLARHAGAFRNDPSTLQELLGDLDPMAGPEVLVELQQVMSPDLVLGAVRSPEQEALLPRIEALVAVVIGYADHFMDEIGGRLITNYPMLTEALRRRRVQTDEADRFIERILGLNLTQDQVERGTTFVAGVVDRAGDDGLQRLWNDERHLPTPSEVDAPGLWLARIDLVE